MAISNCKGCKHLHKNNDLTTIRMKYLCQYRCDGWSAFKPKNKETERTLKIYKIYENIHR